MHLFQININEQESIKCSLYNDTSSDTMVIIASAAGVLQSFYRKLAQFFQTNGTSVVTFDYTGIGKSLNGNIKKENSSLANWGNRDLEAVIIHTIKTFPHHKLILLGHSIGGQLIGLAPSSYKADKIILVAAQSGYWKFWKGVSKIRMWINWYFLVPALIKVFGHLPSKKFSRMESLPKNVAEEWAKWCRSSDYLFANVSYNKLYFDRIKCKLTSISIDDDFFAPKKSVSWLTAKFENAGIKRLHLFPKDFNALKIGHFSLNNEKFKNSIWNILWEETDN
ncbi:alpha/beta fold hydrolase [Leadbetterella sp. DM7]|uniref:alpha/beta hydrolase family protein n=1 Tax=Leadbetterella sp. DM7 TaxID=3235085 RepID=UPI00349EF65D